MRTILTAALFSCALSPTLLGQDAAPSLRNAKQALFLGDSITADGRYVVYVETWLALTQPNPPRVINAGLSSETVSGLSEPGHAGGAFLRPDLVQRLTRVLEIAKPDLVLACYGMNCGVYQPWDAERFVAYQRGIARLREAAMQTGATLVHITPACYDDDVRPLEFSYDGVLGRYATWLIDQRPNGWQVVDVHGPMSAERKRRRAVDPAFTFQPDGVHPHEAGHWFMAQQLLAWLGESRAAAWGSVGEMLTALQGDEALPRLVQRRMEVLRDAYVAAAGHKRPGVPAGLPLDLAVRRAEELTDQIRALCPPSMAP